MILALSLALSTGCSKEKMNELAANVKETTSEITSTAESITTQAQSVIQTAKEQIPSTGSLTLEMTPPIKTNDAKIELISVGDGRPNVIQVLTYAPESTTAYPRALLHGTTTAASVAMLAGQQIKCDLFIQTSASDPMIASISGSPVAVDFSTYDLQAGTIKASISSSNLIRADNQPVSLSGGDLTAVVVKEGE